MVSLRIRSIWKGCGILLCAALQSAAPAPGPGVYRLKRHVVMDQRGFERPMPALSLLLPPDWQFQGQVEDSPTVGCHADLVQVVFRAQSGDGRQRLELFPNHHWQWAADPGMGQMMQANARQAAAFGRRECDIAPPLRAADYLRQQVLPEARPGAQVLGAEPLPDLARALNAQAQEQVQLDNQYGHAWTNGLGDYVLSDHAGFNPNAALKGNWTELQPVK